MFNQYLLMVSLEVLISIFTYKCLDIQVRITDTQKLERRKCKHLAFL